MEERLDRRTICCMGGWAHGFVDGQLRRVGTAQHGMARHGALTVWADGHADAGKAWLKAD